jgi:hypothetical protein
MGSCVCPCTMVVCPVVEDGMGFYSNLKTDSTMALTVAHTELPAPRSPKITLHCGLSSESANIIRPIPDQRSSARACCGLVLAFGGEVI